MLPDGPANTAMEWHLEDAYLWAPKGSDLYRVKPNHRKSISLSYPSLFFNAAAKLNFLMECSFLFIYTSAHLLMMGAEEVGDFSCLIPSSPQEKNQKQRGD